MGISLCREPLVLNVSFKIHRLQEGFRKKKHRVLYHCFRDSRASVPTVQHCSKMVFAQDWTVRSPVLPPTEYMHQIVMTDLKKKKKKVYFRDILLVNKLFHSKRTILE